VEPGGAVRTAPIPQHEARSTRYSYAMSGRGLLVGTRGAPLFLSDSVRAQNQPLPPEKLLFVGTGVRVLDVRHWISPRAIRAAAKAFPFAPNHRHTIFSTHAEDQTYWADTLAGFRTYGARHPQLPLLIASIRSELLLSLPDAEQPAWKKRPWFAV